MLQERWLPAEPRAVQGARMAIRRFPGRLDSQTRHDAELLVSELIGNAVVRPHVRGRVCLRMRYWERRLRVEVQEPLVDPTAFVSDRDPDDAALMVRMLDAFSGAWGHGPADSGGCLAWFELPTGHISAPGS
ncbi:MAG: hypothetical protein ACRDV1_00935 [Actinomycetes bacterium]